MADCSCDFCKFDETCPYSYAESDCEILTIKNAKEIVDSEFINFYEKLRAKNEDLDDDYVSMLINQMRNIILNSKRAVPEFILKELE